MNVHDFFFFYLIWVQRGEKKRPLDKADDDPYCGIESLQFMVKSVTMLDIIIVLMAEINAE